MNLPTAEEVERIAEFLGGTQNENRLREVAALLRSMEDAGTPETDALERDPLDSNDIRAWKTKARNLERQLRAARAMGAEEMRERCVLHFNKQEKRFLDAANCAESLAQQRTFQQLAAFAKEDAKTISALPAQGAA